MCLMCMHAGDVTTPGTHALHAATTHALCCAYPPHQGYTVPMVSHAHITLKVSELHIPTGIYARIEMVDGPRIMKHCLRSKLMP